MYPLLLCSIVAVGVAAERIFVLFANRSAYQSFSRALEEKTVEWRCFCNPEVANNDYSSIINHCELQLEAR